MIRNINFFLHTDKLKIVYINSDENKLNCKYDDKCKSDSESESKSEPDYKYSNDYVESSYNDNESSDEDYKLSDNDDDKKKNY